ncbi:unnamed protein product [Mytilus coruscus]|uniref:Uncharacterized protein n=1 Tax=Mytilus coruscus TaxID=42192 RepID=A0A6J7ZUJ8_MYTCO|nr:unnamed protein product [Mytilus coruscus]
MYGALLVHGKLPPEIRKNIAREHGSHNICLIELLKSIVIEISILEVGQTTDYGFKRMTATCLLERRHDNNLIMTINRPKCHKYTHVCVFCDGKRHSYKCTKVKDPSASIAVVKRKKLCFNCLGSLLAKDCNSQNKCRKKHHTSLCEGRFIAEQKSQSVKTEDRSREKLPSNALIVPTISVPMQLKRSVQNRIDEIRKLTAQDEWRYCQTKENPADLLTRGLTAERFLQNALWFNGHLLTDEKNGRHGSQRSQIVPYNHPS